MEHLLDDEDLEVICSEIPSVPWLGFDHDSSRIYDVVEFESYPVVRAWSPQELEHIQIGVLSRPLDQCLAMLQSWFFFGFLESACQRHFRSTDFVVPGRLLRTNYLRSYIREAVAVLREKTEDDLLPLLQNLAGTQHTVHQRLVMVELERIKQTNSLNMDQIAPIARLATLLGEVLRHFEQLISAVCPSWAEKESPNWCYSTLNKQRLFKRLVLKGWCPSTFEFLQRSTHSVIELASLFEPSDKMARKHQECSDSECWAYNVIEGTYKTVHTNEECDCDYVAARFDVLESFLRNGRISALNFDALLEMSDEPPVVPFESNLHVVVFSHVWSNGLGSHAEKGLPKCQVIRLRNLVVRLNALGGISGPTLAWIDSLCIPRQSDLRRSAIRTMATVFRKASRTLVLDSSLLSYDPDGRPAQELAIRVLAGTWMKRLWTLQEGSLASSLVFLLNGDTFIYATWLVKLSYENCHCLVTAELAAMLVRMGVGQVKASRSLASMLPLVGHRSCSKPDDETLAVGPPMGLDVTPLLREHGEERTAKFWTLLQQVPLAVPFLPGPKLDVPGFRWAMKSLTTSDATAKIWGEPTAVVTDGGLLAEYLVLDLDVALNVEEAKIYHVHFQSAYTTNRQGLLARKYDARLEQTSLRNISDYNMTFMKVSTTSSTPPAIQCVGLALPDRFHPETMAILLSEGSTPSSLDFTTNHTYRYAGPVFMIAREDSVPGNRVSGKVSLKRILLA